MLHTIIQSYSRMVKVPRPPNYRLSQLVKENDVYMYWFVLKGQVYDFGWSEAGRRILQQMRAHNSMSVDCGRIAQSGQPKATPPD